MLSPENPLSRSVAKGCSIHRFVLNDSDVMSRAQIDLSGTHWQHMIIVMVFYNQQRLYQKHSRDVTALMLRNRRKYIGIDAQMKYIPLLRPPVIYVMLISCKLFQIKCKEIFAKCIRSQASLESYTLYNTMLQDTTANP